MLNFKRLLDRPAVYHYARHAMTGGLPFAAWVKLYGLDDPAERIADIGAGPADILRYVRRGFGPQFYLGVDVDERYLDAARARVRRARVPAAFVTMDLRRLADDAGVRAALLEALDRHAITRVLLLGLLHHLDDEAAVATLSLLRQAAGVRTVVTQDILLLPRDGVNNFLARRDRGGHVRSAAGYDALLARAGWANVRQSRTHPGLRAIHYVHYTLSR